MMQIMIQLNKKLPAHFMLLLHQKAARKGMGKLKYCDISLQEHNVEQEGLRCTAFENILIRLIIQSAFY